MKFFHSADWQIGVRFRKFGEAGARLREARLRTLRRALQEAHVRKADAFLIAGDLFEDNQIDSRTIASVYEVLAESVDTPIFILPGNHDPFTGPASIWGRKPFSNLPPHVKVFLAPEAVPAGGGWLLGSPLTQKRSALDPTAGLAELARAIPSGAIKVGLAHGSPAIESRHQADDFPIAVDAATRLGLDYLALGHWHRPLILDRGRMGMAGTPEPTDFLETGAGCIQEIEITEPGQTPQVTPIRVAEWEWRSQPLDLTEFPPDCGQFARALGLEGADLGQTVLQVILQGNANPATVVEFRNCLAERMDGEGILEIVDDTLVEFGSAEMASLRWEHPLLESIFNDLQALAAFAAGSPPASPGHSVFSTGAFLELCEAFGCPAEEANPELFASARRLLLRELRAVVPPC